jgi:hypothetical protein
MIVEVCFFKFAAGAARHAGAGGAFQHLLEISDQKAISACWELMAAKFGFPVAEVRVSEPYLTRSVVLPTVDDLQRIWLSYAQEEAAVDLETQHLALRLFAVHEPPTASPGAAPVTTPVTAPAAAAGALAAPGPSAAGNSASQQPQPSPAPSEARTPAPTPAPAAPRVQAAAAQNADEKRRGGPASSASDLRGAGGAGGAAPRRLGPGATLGRAETFLRLLNAVNEQAASHASQLGMDDPAERFAENLRFFDLVGYGLASFLKLWYLCSQTPQKQETAEPASPAFPPASERAPEDKKGGGRPQRREAAARLLERFPNLATIPNVGRLRRELGWIGRLREHLAGFKPWLASAADLDTDPELTGLLGELALPDDSDDGDDGPRPSPDVASRGSGQSASGAIAPSQPEAAAPSSAARAVPSAGGAKGQAAGAGPAIRLAPAEGGSAGGPPVVDLRDFIAPTGPDQRGAPRVSHGTDSGQRIAGAGGPVTHLH